MQTYFINVWVKCVWEHVGALKVAFSANKSSSINHHRRASNVLISVSCGGGRVSFKFLIFFPFFPSKQPAGISLSSLFFVLFCFVLSIRTDEKNKKYSSAHVWHACDSKFSISPLKYYISLRDTLHRKVFKNTRREKKQTHLYIIEQRSSGT